MRKSTLVGILLILFGIPIVYFGYYIAIPPRDWIYGGGRAFAIGIILMFMGLLGIIFDEMKVRRRKRAHEKKERERHASAT